MPTLDLGNWLDITDPSSPMRLLAAMAHPNEPDKQKSLIASIIGSNKKKLIGGLKMNLQKETIKPSDKEEWKKLSQDAQRALKKNLERAFNSSGGIQTIIDSPRYKEIAEKYGSGCYQGLIAGLILFMIMQMEKQDGLSLIGGGSVKKAVFLIEETRKKQAQDASIPLSNKTIKSYWTNYKSISHYWAAYIMFGYFGYPDEFSPHRSSGLIGFLAITEEFRKFGESHIPFTLKHSLLSNDETWKPPEDFPLCEVNFDLPPLTAPELEVLGTYQAPTQL